VGIAPGDLEFGEDQDLSREAVVHLRTDGRFNLLLVIRNEGKLAARSVKIVLDNESFDEIPLVLRFSDFTQESANGYAFPGGLEDRQVTVYSGYDAKFWGQVRDFPSSAPLPWHLHLHCKVWADGLGCAVNEPLMIVVKSPEVT
jgi:hypothetical protein